MYIQLKQYIDFLIALIVLIIIWPLFLVIALCIQLDSRGPVFFKQKRVGKNNKHFYILKFRTMRIDTPKDTPTHMFQDSSTYITNIGGFLRKTSLDELPQLINILKGEMSIIGPRPALWNQHDLIAERDRFDINGISPGITGWAQINGRDELPINLKTQYDREYLEKMSMIFDLKILLRTVMVVINRDGVKEGAQISKLK
jgi:O-antigen biosynthesis protein WbqP